MRKNVAVLFQALIIVCLVFPGCKKATTSQQSTDLSSLGAYVAGYVPEVIKSTDPVRIRFAQPVVVDSLAGSAVDPKLYSITPAVPGEAVWEDAYTFSFRPKDKFTAGANHTLSIELGKLFPDVDVQYKTIYFNFNIRPVDVYVQLNPASPSDDDASLQIVTGQVRTSERVSTADAERTISVSFANNSLKPTWEHSEDGLVHGFTIESIKRATEDEKLTVTWDGSVIQSPSKGSTFVIIPAIGDFKVIDVTASAEGTREVRIVFSDHLDPTADLSGMVMVDGSDKGFETKRAKNVLSIFTNPETLGDFTVRLDAGVRSSDGKILGESESFQLSYEDIAPQVELLGKGNIVPFSNEVILPFKAVNLTAVDVEIFEIFENNVLQFLQYTDLWYANGFEAVGRVVGKHVVQLNSLQSGVARNQWQRYAIDLSRYTDIHPGSIYEVRIGFRKGYSLYACEGGEEDNRTLEEGTDESIWQYYYSYQRYDYENRDNPCRPEYYSADHFVRRNVLASNLGLSAKSGSNDAIQVSVHDLRTTEPIAGCEVNVYDFQQQLIGKARTNGDGVCEVAFDRDPAFLVANHRGEKGYLKVMDGNALSVSDFEVEGTTRKDGLQGFIYCDRDIWRPGDTIFLNFILETNKSDNSDHPVTCTVFNPRGQKRFEQTKTTRVGPVYSFPVATDVSDLTGNWRAEVAVGGVEFNRTLKVETIKPNRLKINVDSEGPIEAWKKETIIPINVTWLHGAPAGGLKATVELGLTPQETTFKGFSQYRFDDPARHVEPTVTTIFDGTLDANGNARVAIPHDTEQLLPGKMSANFKTRVFEKGGDFSTDQFSAEWLPFQTYVGISIPDNRWGYKQLEEGKDNTISLVVVDGTGKGVSGRELTVGVYQADWSWWWNDNNYELAQYNSAQHLGAFSQQTVSTKADGKAEFVFKPLDDGLYLIRVCDTKSGHCSGDYAYSGYFYGEEDGRTAIAKLTFSADKEKYTAGENAELNIPSAEGSLVIVSIESDQEVLSTHELKATDELTSFSFQTTPEMAPNVYAHVRLIQPHNSGNNDLPLRMYGVIPIMVENPKSKLEPVIAMPDVLKPESTFEISVSEKNGEGMAYTIAIVDEGLLDLTRFKTPDPWNFFYAKQALGVKSWDLYDNVLGALGGPVERILAIGGDGSGVQIQAVNEVNRFKPVVIHLGPFMLRPGSKATHKVTMPNYVGSVRAMVVAATTNQQYGSAEKAVPVKSPVMLLATMPRVLAPGEEIAIPVNVFAMDDKVRTVEVSIRGNKNVAITGPNRKTVSFDKQGDQLISFSADVAQQIGTGEIWIDATAGNEKASQHIELAVRNPNPFISEVTEVMLEKGKKWDGQAELVGMNGTNEITLEVSMLFPANLDERLSYLIQYPYGCLEQTISSAFPQLYVENLLELAPEEKARVQHNVRGAIAKVSRYLNPAGGFSYWPGEQYVNEWTNSYTGHFLIEAQRAGYFVEARLIDHWKTFQASRAQRFTTTGENVDLLEQAYRLYTLALAGAPEMGAMNRLRSSDKLANTARFMLAAAYANSGQSNAARQLIEVPATAEEYKLAGRTYGSETRDRALLVEAMLVIGDREKALPIVKRIADDIGTEAWYSTQSTAFALIALSRFAAQYKSGDLYFAFAAEGKERQTVRQNKLIFKHRIGEDQPKAVSVENLSEAPLYVRLIRRGRPLEPVSKPINDHLALKVIYNDMQGKTIDPARLAQGTDFVAIVSVTNPATFAGNLNEVALQNIFPSGWEIINQRLDNLSERFKNSEFEYQDIRDDRVYTFFDLYGKTTNTYSFMLNAAYPGRYVMPAVYCEAMYDRAVKAAVPGRWVEVTTDQIRIAKAGVTGQ